MRESPNHEVRWIPATWPAPSSIHAGTTTRYGGHSAPPFDGFNLAQHVGDKEVSVLKNRQELRTLLNLPSDPVWIEQVHGNHVIRADETQQDLTADGSYTKQGGIVCAVLTADCVPVLLCSRSGSEVAAVHAGWRGLCKDILANALRRFSTPPAEILAWFGPHIGPAAYEVKADMRDTCMNAMGDAVSTAFTHAGGDHYRADLEMMIKQRLRSLGVLEIFTCGHCCFEDDRLFYSYRRTRNTGRMASLIWINGRSMD